MSEGDRKSRPGVRSDHRARQIARLATWTEGLITDNQQAMLRRFLIGEATPEDQTELAVVAVMEYMILKQFVTLDTCTDLGAMTGSCQLCGAAIRYQFYIRNTANARTYILGSDCIENYVDAGFKRKSGELSRQARETRLGAEHRKLVEDAWKATEKGASIRDFIKSVADGFKQYGRLTDKQAAALMKIRDRRKS